MASHLRVGFREFVVRSDNPENLRGSRERFALRSSVRRDWRFRSRQTLPMSSDGFDVRVVALDMKKVVRTGRTVWIKQALWSVWRLTKLQALLLLDLASFGSLSSLKPRDGVVRFNSSKDGQAIGFSI
jgi:hypothetical protein